MDGQVISFQNVSKKYRLGLTRQSIPGTLSRWIRRAVSSHITRSDSSPVLWALKDVSFTLAQGESLALVGSNGAGKTTTLKLLSQITSPSSGRIHTYGKLAALIELGSGFHPDLTGRENIYLNGTILGLKRKEIDAHFDEILTFSELERFIDTPIKRYSSGMVVRLGFAVASCIKPDILLIDEVLAVGDIHFQQKCLDRIRELLRQGTSIIFVSHNLYLVKAVCSKALYLDQGMAKAYGSVTDVIKIYERDIHERRAQKNENLETDSLELSNSGIEITRIQVLNPTNLSTTQFTSQQPIEIQIHYDAHRDIADMRVSAHVYRSDGLACFQVRSILDGVRFSLKRGQGIVKIIINPVLLTTGTYFATGAFLDEQDTLVFANGRSDWFYVEGAGLTSDENSGIYEPAACWEQVVVSGGDRC